MMKTPLVLLSGLLSDARVWAYQKIHLSDLAQIHTISTDKNTPEGIVQEILEAAPATFALAGHSMGGWLCLEIMRAAPSRVQKLCLLNTTARGDTANKKAKREEMIAEVRAGHFPLLAKRLADLFVFKTSEKLTVEKMFFDVGPEAFIRQETAMLQRRDCLEILPTISCPTLIVHAAQDKVFSLEEHQEMADKIFGAELAIIEDSGHMSPMEMPQKVTDLLRHWLTS